ncbi:hypothetical protein C8Q77DRAFT_566095 [Trametes polyzona]|nr:hypothetical protein C8Q77DRAFT_566095 [Trametes polyzona]
MSRGHNSRWLTKLQIQAVSRLDTHAGMYKYAALGAVDCSSRQTPTHLLRDNAGGGRRLSRVHRVSAPANHMRRWFAMLTFKVPSSRPATHSRARRATSWLALPTGSSSSIHSPAPTPYGGWRFAHGQAIPPDGEIGQQATATVPARTGEALRSYSRSPTRPTARKSRVAAKQVTTKTTRRDAGDTLALSLSRLNCDCAREDGLDRHARRPKSPQRSTG